MRLSGAAAITATVALVVSTTAAAETPAHFRARANAICAKGVAAIVAVPSPRAASGYLKYFEKEAALGDSLLLELAALKPPLVVEPPYNRALIAQRAVEATLHTLVARLKATSTPKVVVAAIGRTLVKRTNTAHAAWRATGVTKCG